MIIKKIRNHKTTNTINKLIDYVETKSIIDYAQEKTAKTWYINLPNEKALAINIIKTTQQKNIRSSTSKTYHYIISFREGEKPSDETLKQIEQKISEKLGFSQNHRVLAVHDDTAHYHMHVVINKIHPAKHTNITPFNDFLSMDEIAKQIEKEFKLQIDNRIDKKRRYKNNKAKDFEAHTGFQSLETYIKEKIQPHIQDIINCADKNNWQNLHSLLDKYNIHIQQKTNGLIFQDIQTKIQIKASSISRNFSKSKLEQKLGIFQEKQIQILDKNALNPPHNTLNNVNIQTHQQAQNKALDSLIEIEKNQQSEKKYEKQPIHKNSDILWEKYWQIENKKLEQQTKSLETAKKSYSGETTQIKQLKSQQKEYLKVRGIPYKDRINLNLNIEINAKQAHENAYASYKNNKQQIYKETKKENWLEFLIKEAKTNPRALQLLQSNLKNKHAQSLMNKGQDNKIQAMEFLRQNNQYIGYGKIAKNGEIHYKTSDDGYFKAGKDGIYIIKDTPNARKQALEVAEKSYGKNLKVQGSKEFIQEISKTAQEKNINISDGLGYDR